MCASGDDEPRISALLKEMIDKEEITPYRKFTHESAVSKSNRKRKFAREAEVTWRICLCWYIILLVLEGGNWISEGNDRRNVILGGCDRSTPGCSRRPNGKPDLTIGRKIRQEACLQERYQKEELEKRCCFLCFLWFFTLCYVLVGWSCESFWLFLFEKPKMFIILK